VAEQPEWNRSFSNLDAHQVERTVGDLFLLSSWRVSAAFNLRASFWSRYLSLNSLSGTLPTQIGMLTSLSEA